MRILNKNGFTLIELLVVITIIGILGTASTAVYNRSIMKARDGTRSVDIRSINDALLNYYFDNSIFIPKTTLAGGNQFSGGNNAATKQSLKDTRDEFLKYMSSIPQDPLSGTENAIIPQQAIVEGVTPLQGTYSEYIYNTDIFNHYEVSATFEKKIWGDDGGDDPYRLELTNGGNLRTAAINTRFMRGDVPGFACIGSAGNIFNACQNNTVIVIKSTSNEEIDAFQE